MIPFDSEETPEKQEFNGSSIVSQRRYRVDIHSAKESLRGENLEEGALSHLRPEAIRRAILKNWEFKNPPIWEAAIGARTQQGSFLDQFEIASVHSLFENRFPRVERQPALGAVEPFSSGAHPVPFGVASLQFESVQGVLPTRWWFTSIDGRNLFQIQDDFIGRNWRRTDWTPATEQGYPNFDGLLSDFKSGITSLDVYNSERQRETPAPSVCDVLFVNHLSGLREDGSKRKFRDILPWLTFSDDYLKAGVNFSWYENISEKYPSLVLQIQGAYLGVLSPFTINVPPKVEPIFRLSFNARSSCSSWAEHFEFAEIAHDRIRERLLSLTTNELQSTW